MRIDTSVSYLGMIFILLIGVHSSYAIDADPQVPTGLNTASQYCSSGTCSTGTVHSIPSKYTFSNHHLPIIFVNLSQTCENMLKANITGCPSLGSMVPFDTSNQYVSGKFVKVGNDTIRTKPEVKNHWLYYEGKSFKTVCVECYADITTMEQSQQIIIQPTGFSFVDQVANAVKGQWISYSDRYMQGCDTATISNNFQLLNDTIHYMLNGCKNTSFNFTTTHKVNNTPWQYDNPFSTLHYQDQIKKLMHGHNNFNGNHTSGGFGPSLCINGKTCDFKDPYAKKGYLYAG